jgi:hypothetical protein
MMNASLGVTQPVTLLLLFAFISSFYLYYTYTNQERKDKGYYLLEHQLVACTYTTTRHVAMENVLEFACTFYIIFLMRFQQHKFVTCISKHFDGLPVEF